MIRNTLLAIAAVATIAGAASTAQAGDYGHGGYNSHSHGYTTFDTYKPRFFYKRKCRKIKVGHRKVWDAYSYRYFFKPIFKTRCRRIKVWL